MAAPQNNIDDGTPLGANLVAGGAVFRVFGPSAIEVFVSGDFNGWKQQDPAAQLVKRGNYWGGFIPGIKDSAAYKFFVVGAGSTGFKRDPYAREIVPGTGMPNCVVRDPNTFPWHDQGFIPPAFNNLIVYQFHTGTYYGRDAAGNDNRRGRDCTFLDVIDRIEYLAELGVTAIEPLPINEFETETSLGYNGSDLFAPEFRYTMLPGDSRIPRFLATINGLLAKRGKPPLPVGVLDRPINQLKALVDLCHVYGMAVLLDVVYNHAGDFGSDKESIFFWDLQQNGNNNNSLYFTSQPADGTGGLVFAYWNQDVRQFLIDNAKYFYREYHTDGFRFDEVTIIDKYGGRQFCKDLTDTLHFLAPSHVLIAEYWADQGFAVRDTGSGGLGFDGVWSAGVRDTVRSAIAQAAGGAQARVSFDPVRDALNRPFGFPALWKSVEAVETHDEVFAGRAPRITHLADGSNARSWYARSRSRVATGIVLTAPGIPLIFMGQEFLEDKQWSDSDPNLLIFWDGVDKGTDKAMVNHVRFTRELIALRRRQPALRGEGINVFHVHDDNRVIAYQRWVEGSGRDVVVVVSLNESTFWSYQLGFPGPGRWLEVFNSDVYDNWVNPIVAGNGSGINADGGPMHGLPNSASVVIPANGFVVFARDGGD